MELAKRKYKKIQQFNRFLVTLSARHTVMPVGGGKLLTVKNIVGLP